MQYRRPYSSYFVPGPPLGNLVEDAINQAKKAAGKAAGQGGAAVASAIDATMPDVENQIVGAISSGATQVLNNVWPDVERRTNAMVGKYETRYRSMAAKWEKYAVPVAMVAMVVGAMAASASFIIIRNELKKKKGG